MQTFLPHPSFQESAQALDYRRLGKQRVECKQIYLALTQPEYGWKNHPAVKMWAGYEQALVMYARTICREWRSRGYKDTLLDYFLSLPCEWVKAPKWYGDAEFHRSHQSNLIRKDPTFYKPKFPNVPDNLPYIWPTDVTK
jgi:hypothetical protein